MWKIFNPEFGCYDLVVQTLDVKCSTGKRVPLKHNRCHLKNISVLAMMTVILEDLR